MTKEEFHNEKMYQATMAMVRRMHSEGLISLEEYERVEQIFLKKYKPLIGTVYAGMALTPCPS
ncbi:SHOCT domain-containing protein [Selenomonas noxia]|uniref:SHOCT domain-containing protein n=1 Tax=Selenomonas noxia TaxID=135083 RepID=UPI0028EC95B7|nr:SHOCT domain-containing protein [Selenomonas noxia]